VLGVAPAAFLIMISVIFLMLAQKGPKRVVDYNSTFDIRHVLYVTTPKQSTSELNLLRLSFDVDTETTITTDEINSDIFHR
jgi:hypothetical protein